MYRVDNNKYTTYITTVTVKCVIEECI